MSADVISTISGILFYIVSFTAIVIAVVAEVKHYKKKKKKNKIPHWSKWLY